MVYEKVNMFKGLKNLFIANDKKPLMVSLIIQRDDCSRLLCEFGEKRLEHCTKLAIVWKNSGDEAFVETSDSLKDEEAIGMLVKAAHRIGADNGNQKTNIFKS